MLQYMVFFDVAIFFFDVVVYIFECCNIFFMLQYIYSDVAMHVFHYCNTYFCDVVVFTIQCCTTYFSHIFFLQCCSWSVSCSFGTRAQSGRGLRWDWGTGQWKTRVPIYPLGCTEGGHASVRRGQWGASGVRNGHALLGQGHGWGGGLRWDRGIGHDWGAEDMNFDIFPTLRSGRTDFRVQG